MAEKLRSTLDLIGWKASGGVLGTKRPEAVLHAASSNVSTSVTTPIKMLTDKENRPQMRWER